MSVIEAVFVKHEVRTRQRTMSHLGGTTVVTSDFTKIIKHLFPILLENEAKLETSIFKNHVQQLSIINPTIINNNQLIDNKLINFILNKLMVTACADLLKLATDGPALCRTSLGE